MNKIHFIHRIDDQNIGDMKSCPLEYFKYLFQDELIIKHDIYNVAFNKINLNDIVILGGGRFV